MAKNNPWKPETRAAQALGWVDAATGAVVPPLHTATTYERDADLGYPRGVIYTRDDNPTYKQAEALLASLENGSDAWLFASGMAAVTAAFQTLDAGDHVVAPAAGYYGVRHWLTEHGRRAGLHVDLVPPGDLPAIAAAVRPGKTRAVWIETPANPVWQITDIAAVAEITHGAGAWLGVDNTVPTPVLTRPLDLGADLVMHSATKYLGGHGDVLAGALVVRETGPLAERIAAIRHDAGAVLGPFEAWLLLRGMRTLYLRVKASCASAAALADFLAAHPAVERVLYPGLADFPGHVVAARQMQGGFGGMVSVCLNGGARAAIDVAARLQVFKRATSLGGVESLVEHRASIEGSGTPTPDNLLRLSVGIEDIDDLIADFAQALDE